MIGLLGQFFRKYPPLQFGIALLISAFATLAKNPFILLFLVPLLLQFPIRILFAMLLMGIYTYLLFPIPSLPMEGTALFHIESIKKQYTPFSQSIYYQGIVKKMDGKRLQLPARIYVKAKNRPLADKDYLIHNARLEELFPHHYLLKTSKESTWEAIPKTRSFAEKRHTLKNAMKKELRKHYSDKNAYGFVTALATGNVENQALAFAFNRVGLSHLLAISGFHFALLAFFIGAILRPFFSIKLLSIMLLLSATLFCLYLGSTPSLDRAYLSVALFLVGYFIRRRARAFNALGIALIIALIVSPRIIFHVGFQLSFAATLSILLFLRPIEALLSATIKKYSLKEITQMPLSDQCAYLCLTFIRTILALNAAVLMGTLPLILLHFHRFPLMSLIYNLFFPPLAALSLLLLLIALLFFFAPPISAFFHAINHHYLIHLLRMPLNPPPLLDFSLRMHPSTILTAITVALIFLIGITLYEMQKTSEKLLFPEVSKQKKWRGFFHAMSKW